MSSSFNTDNILRRIESNTKCLSILSGEGIGSKSVTSDTQSGSLATSATLTSGNHAEATEMRAVEVLNSGGNDGETLTVDITLIDGSTLSFTVFHNVQWSFQIQQAESPIQSVVVTNNGATTLSVILNVVSRK